MGRGVGRTKNSTVAASPRVLIRHKTRSSKEFDSIGNAIRANLTDDLLKPEYRNAERPFTGHCYVASEAYYHLNGGKAAGLKPVGMAHEGSQHWWIEDKDGNITDLTAEQFKTPVPYSEGKGRAF